MLTAIHASYHAPLAPPLAEAGGAADDHDGKLSPEDLTDAASVMFLLMLNGQQSHDRNTSKAVDATSGLKAQERAKELDDFQKQIKSLSAKGFFDSIGQVVVDTFKGLVTADFNALGQDFKDMDNPKFWGDLQKVAAVVAEVASAVVSGVTLGAGSASVVAVTAFVVGVVFSTAGMVEENFHVLAQLTNNPEFGKYFALGCMIGSAICGLTGAVANGVKAAASEATKEVVAAALKNPTVWQHLKDIAATTATVANVVGACAAVPSAILTYEGAQVDIDAKKREQQEQFLQRFIDTIIETMKSQHKATDADLKQARETITTNQDTQLTAASMLRV